MRTINHESDFKIIEGFKDGSSILEAPFRFTYYTKVSRGVYVAEHNGSEFINCHPTDDGRVVVPFDSPKLGMGVLMVKREFFLSDADFKDGICNLVSVESAGITLDKGATDMDGEVNIELFPFYQQGDTGKSAYQEWLDLGNEGTTADFIASLRGAAFTYEDFTPEQLESLKGKDGKDGKDGIDGKDGSDASVVLSTHSALFHDEGDTRNPIAIRLSSGLGEYAESEDVFLGNEGLYISSNRSLGILLSSESGLEIGTNAVVNGKTFDSGRGLSVKLGTGLIKDGNGLSVKVSTDGSIEATLKEGVRVGTLSIGTDTSKRPHIFLGTGLETTGNRNIFIDSKKLIGTSSEAMYQVDADAISEKSDYGYRLRTGVRLSTTADMEEYVDVHHLVLGSCIALNEGDTPTIRVKHDESFYTDLEKSLKLSTGGVKGHHIANMAVGNNHIANDAVTENHIAYGAVTKDKLRNGSVTKDKIDYKAVTEEKLSDEVNEKLNKPAVSSAEDVAYEGGLEATNVKEAIEELDTKKVDHEDNAPKLTAGFANNLVGRGEATEEVIGFRPSGGDTSIEDGTARIAKIKGETVVWNQVWKTSTALEKHENGVHFIVQPNGSVLVYTDSTGATQLTTGMGNNGGDVIKDHKMLLMGCPKGGSLSSYCIRYSDAALDIGNGAFATNTYSGKAYWPSIRIEQGTIIPESNPLVFERKLYDLTQMFGAGNEPTTIEEFNARKPIGIDEYAYNEGELISTNVDEVKSIGFNAWDGSREWGDILSSNGGDNASSIHWRSDFIKVIPNEKYIVEAVGYTGCGLRTRFYTPDKTYIATKDANGLNANSGSTIVIPANAGYMRIAPYTSVIPYDASICIHLVHTGYRNGEYEPYKEFRRDIPIKDIKDSEGNQLFPNGLLSAGSVYDEITATKAIKRIGVVDMGTLNWRYYSNYGGIDCFECQDLLIKSNIHGKLGNILCAQYNNTPQNKVSEENLYSKSIMLNNSTIFIRDSSYTNAGNFKAAMSGVMLYYELAEPIEVDLEEPLNLDYEVCDFGTEEAISTEATTPLNADIIYQFNAVDRIRDNSRHTEEANALLGAKADKAAVENALAQKINRSEIEENVDNLTQISVVDKTNAQALALLSARLESVESLLREITNGYYFDELVARKLKVQGSELIKTGSGAPSVQPDFLGQLYIDTTNQKSYTGCGIDAVSNWKANN